MGLFTRTVKEHFEFSDLVEEKCGEFSEKHKFCSNSLSLLVDLAQRKANEESLKKAIFYCEKILSLPTMYQKKYWELRLSQMKESLEGFQEGK